MMQLREITAAIESVLPLSMAERWDNSGLQVGLPSAEISGALVCVDVTDAVLVEACQLGLNLIVSHHPLLFHPLKHLTASTLSERVAMAAVEKQVAIYAAHTNLDNWSSGVSARMAQKLGLTDCTLLSTLDGRADAGSGVVGDLPQPMSEAELLLCLKCTFAVPDVRYSMPLGREVKRVALCGGAGGFLTENALAAGAEAFVTADLKHHDFVDAAGRLLLADIGHYESEQCTKELLLELLSEKLPNFAVRLSATDRSPINHL